MGKKIISVNKKAKFDFDISDTFEAGVVLEGQEVKSLRLGKVSMRDAFAKVIDGEVYLHNLNITGYKFADLSDYVPTRTRKLLLHRKEIESLESKLKDKRLTLVPVEMYFAGKKVKVLLGLGRGRKQYQKRELKKRQDVEREVRREFKERLR